MTVKIKNVSTDVESWGKRAGCDIRSIGCYRFDPMDVIQQVNESNTFYVACNNPLLGTYSSDHYTQLDLDMIDGPHRRYNLRRDPETVKWWHSQPAELQDAFQNPVDLKQALIAYREFLYSISEDIRDGIIYDIHEWSHGAGFDPPIIEAAFIACDLEYPLYYRSRRDTRTAFDDAGVVNHSTFLKNHQGGPLHHALWDSVTQGKAIATACWLMFKRSESVYFSAMTHLKKIADPTIIRDGFAQRELAEKAIEELRLVRQFIFDKCGNSGSIDEVWWR